MSREIKYRAFVKATRDMVDVIQINFRKGTLFGTHWEYGETRDLSLSEVELLQYTGLKDKNGKAYCQEDLIKYKNKIYRLIKGTYMFELVGFNETYQDNPYDFFSEGAYLDGEIVGNIYEHPHLLEV